MATETTSISGDSESTLKTVQIQVAGHDTLIKYLLVGIVSSILLLAFNLVRDNSINDRLTAFATEAADSRIKMAANETSYQQVVMSLKSNLDLFKQCLKLNGWSECFN